MGRDYAPRGARPRPPKRASGGVLPGWVWMIAGLSLGLAVAALVYIRRPVAEPPMPPARSTTTPEKNAKNSRITLPPEQPSRFTFYELLPSQEVVIPREEIAKQAPKARAPAAPADAAASSSRAADGTYFIQVASYRSQAEAERQKASLALLGVEAGIQSVTIDARDTYYRVRVGPVQGAAHAHSTMVRLEENGVSALLVKVK